MTHLDHVKLIERGVVRENSIWADFGSGEGAFTLALRDLAGPEVEIFSIDRNEESLKKQIKKFDSNFRSSKVHFIQGDFTEKIALPSLDGAIAANSLHFQKDRISQLELIKKRLKPNGRLIIVEYNVDEGNSWVPFPFSFQTFQKLAEDAGFQKPVLLSKTPSRFLNEIYCAMALNNG